MEKFNVLLQYDNMLWFVFDKTPITEADLERIKIYVDRFLCVLASKPEKPGDEYQI